MSSLQSSTTAENTSTETNCDKVEHEFVGLPAIDSKPDCDVVIFDGNCNFCHKQVRNLHWFANGSLTFASLHDPRVTERFPDLTLEQMMKQMYVVTVNGKRFGGAAALRYLSRKFPRLWLAAPFLHIPFSLPLWQYVYDRIASIRYQINGEADCDDGSCQFHIK